MFRLKEICCIVTNVFYLSSYESAEKLFLEALAKIERSAEDISVDSWEPLFSNLGHVYRRLK